MYLTLLCGAFFVFGLGVYLCSCPRTPVNVHIVERVIVSRRLLPTWVNRNPLSNIIDLGRPRAKSYLTSHEQKNKLVAVRNHSGSTTTQKYP